MIKLIKLQKYILSNDFQLSRLKSTNNKKDRNHAVLTLFGYCIASLIIIGYVIFIAFDLYTSKSSTLFLPILSSILFWSLGVWTILSGIKKLIISSDTEFIFSLPIPLWQAKLFGVMKLTVLYSFIITIAISIGVFMHVSILPSFWFVLLFALILIVTLPVLIIATTFFVSLTVKIILNFFKIYSHIIEVLLTFLIFLFPLLYNIYQLSSLDYKVVFSTSSPAFLFSMMNRFTSDFEFLNLLTLLAVTLIFTFFTGYIFIKQYDFLITNYSTPIKKRVLNLNKIHSNSLLQKLFFKELQLYLSSVTYVSNTILTPAALFMGSLLYLFHNSSLLYDYSLELSFIILSSKDIFILFTTICLLLTTTTSSSLSIERHRIWILLTSPLSFMDLAVAKVSLNLILFVPGLIFTNYIYNQHFSSSFFDSLLFISFTISSLLLISMMGLLINLKFPNYNWSNEMEIIKQGKATIVTAIISTCLISLTGILIVLNFAFSFQLLVLINSCLIGYLVYKLKKSSLISD